MAEFTLSLFDPNTLLPHRAGIAGLALALSAIDPKNAPLQWQVTEDAVQLSWEESDFQTVKWLLSQTYQIEEGLLIASPLQLDRQGRFTFNQGILSTFLQHGKQKGFEEDSNVPKKGKKKSYKTRSLAFPIEDGQPEIVEKYTLLEWCYYLDWEKIAKGFRKDKFLPEIEVKGHHLPGLVECFLNGAYLEPPERFLPLLFLPLACGYYKLPSYPKLKNSRSALVIPEVTNLLTWVKRRQEFSGRTYRNFRAGSAGESALRFLLQEKLIVDSRQCSVKYCEVYQLGGQPWDGSQPYLKQSVFRVNADDKMLELYQIAAQCFPAQVRQNDKGGETWLALSKVLPWIADNLVAGKVWYAGFFEFRKSHDLYERKGLVSMTKYLTTDEQILFDAVQGAFRNYLRGQSKQAEKQGRPLDYGQVTDKVIYRLQRPSTQQEFAKALVDFLSQYRNKTLRSVGPQIYWWIHQASNWKKARDLSLLAIATYQGKGKENPSDSPDDSLESSANDETESQEFELSL